MRQAGYFPCFTTHHIQRPPHAAQTLLRPPDRQLFCSRKTFTLTAPNSRRSPTSWAATRTPFGCSGADGEYHSIDAEKAHEFLAVLVRNTDRHTGLLTLEADADPKFLTKHERMNLVPLRQFDTGELLATDALSEDTTRVKKDTLFTEDVWEIWDPTGTELLGLAKSYETGKRIALLLRGQGINAVFTKTARAFHTV